LLQKERRYLDGDMVDIFCPSTKYGPNIAFFVIFVTQEVIRSLIFAGVDMMYLCTGFREDFLPRDLVDAKWISGPARLQSQRVRHQKNEVCGCLAPWYFSIPTPRGEVKHNIMTKIMITFTG
jgi:hypothetical protein